MDLPPSAVPRRRAPPQGRLCGRSPASSERRRVASLVAVPAGAPVSVARPRPPPKETTAPGKPAPCGSRASPDPGRRPSTRRTVRPRRGPGAGGTRRQPSPARPAVAGYGISPRSRCGLPEPRHCIGKRGRPVHNPEPDMAGFAPQRSVVHLGATTWVQTSAGTCHTEPSPPDTSGLVPPCSGISVLPAPGWPLYTPESRRLYHDFASGVRDDRPGLDSCLRSLRKGRRARRVESRAGGSPSSSPSPAPDTPPTLRPPPSTRCCHPPRHPLEPSPRTARTTPATAYTAASPHPAPRQMPPHPRGFARSYRSGPPNECRRSPTRPAAASALWTPNDDRRQDGRTLPDQDPGRALPVHRGWIVRRLMSGFQLLVVWLSIGSTPSLVLWLGPGVVLLSAG